MDDIDSKILQFLQKNSREPFIKIAQNLGLSEATVRNRVNKMVRSGAISKFTIETTKSGLRAFILITVNPSTPNPQIAGRISELNGVDAVFETSGQYDIAVIISGIDISSLNQCIDQIRNLSGITSTNTLLVLKKW